jgi:hypothetical protein
MTTMMVSVPLYQSMTASVTATMTPSITVSRKVSDSVRWIASTERKRETMSPMWRFSNHASGSRSRRANSVSSSCRLSRVLM